MKTPFQIRFEEHCKFALRGFPNSLFRIFLNKPSTSDIKVKIYTDYDNYVRIEPKVITFEKGSNQMRKVLVKAGLSKSYQLEKVKFKIEIL